MKTALGFFIFFIVCIPFGQSARAQNPVPAFSSARATAEILSPASMEMRQTKEFNILELPGLIVKLDQYEKNHDAVQMQNAPLLQMNFAEFTIVDFSAQQFAVTIPFNASGISIVKGKSYVTATESLSIISNENEKIDRQAFKVKGTLSFNDLLHPGNKDSSSPLIVTVNFN